MFFYNTNPHVCVAEVEGVVEHEQSDDDDDSLPVSRSERVCSSA